MMPQLFLISWEIFSTLGFLLMVWWLGVIHVVASDKKLVESKGRGSLDPQVFPCLGGSQGPRTIISCIRKKIWRL